MLNRLDTLMPEFRVVYGSYWAIVCLVSLYSILAYTEDHTLLSVSGAAVFVSIGGLGAWDNLWMQRGEPLDPARMSSSVVNVFTQLHVIYGHAVFLVTPDMNPDVRTLALVGAIMSALMMIYMWIKRGHIGDRSGS